MLKRLIIAVADYGLLALAVLLAFQASPSFVEPVVVGGRLNPLVTPTVILLPLFMVCGLEAVEFGMGRRRATLSELAISTVLGVGIGVLVYQLTFALTTATLTSRFVHLFAFVFGNIVVLVSHLMYERVARRYARRLLVFGSEVCLRAVEEANRYERFRGYQVIGRLDRARGSTADLVKFCGDGEIDDLLVEIDGAIAAGDSQILMQCVASGVNVIEVSAFFEKNYGQVYEAGIDDRWFWGYDPAHAHPYFTIFKRGVDVVVSILGLCVCVPIALIVYCVVKIQDGGPVLYSQLRMGVHNRVFRIYKFRTMRTDAEKDGARWASKGDARVTRLGRIMRKTRVDEIPQFWNILIGEMSFIGPRPERPEIIENIASQIPFYKYRHLVKPGLTGWAQINYPYGASVEDSRRKLAYDLYYIKYASITLDLTIMLRTAVAAAKGAR